MYCPKCGENLRTNAKFCHRCGTPIQPSLQQVPASIQPEKSRKIATPQLIVLIFIILCCLSLAFLLATGVTFKLEDTTLPVLDETPSMISESSDSMQGLLELSEQQQMIVDQFDLPDTFIIMEIDDPQGNHVRLETWVYCQGKTSYTFIDGIFESDGEAITLPDDYFPTPYHPIQFPLGASPDQIQSLLTHVTLVPFENSEMLQEGIRLYISEQLILGFQEDRLFYVDAMAFVPDGDE